MDDCSGADRMPLAALDWRHANVGLGYALPCLLPLAGSAHVWLGRNKPEALPLLLSTLPLQVCQMSRVLPDLLHDEQKGEHPGPSGSEACLKRLSKAPRMYLSHGHVMLDVT